MNKSYYLVAFNSINYANYLESELKRYGHDVLMIETPEYLTKDYYIALKIYVDALQLAGKIMKETNIEEYKIYKKFYSDGKKMYKEIKLNNSQKEKGFLEVFFSEGDTMKGESKEKDIEVVEMKDVKGILNPNQKKTPKEDGANINVFQYNVDREEIGIKGKNLKIDKRKQETKKDIKSDPIELIKKLVHIRNQVN